MKKEKRQINYKWVSVASVVTVVIIWHIYATINAGGVLPTPVAVIKALIDKITNPNPDGALLHQHLLSSLRIALSGYAIGLIVGIPLGICMAWYTKFDWFARPLFDLIRPVPGIAWIPVMIVLFGIGVFPKAMVIFLSSFTGCVVNSYSGIKQTQSVHLWVGQTYGASNFTLLRRIAIPTALPLIFTGMKTALGTSWGALVAAELLASTMGLGFMIQQARVLLRVDIVIAGMIVIGIVGAILSALLSLLEKKILRGGRW